MLESYHYQVAPAMADKAILAGFFILWLKWRTVFAPPKEAIATDVVNPIVLLAQGWPLDSFQQ